MICWKKYNLSVKIEYTTIECKEGDPKQKNFAQKIKFQRCETSGNKHTSENRIKIQKSAKYKRK